MPIEYILHLSNEVDSGFKILGESVPRVGDEVLVRYGETDVVLDCVVTRVSRRVLINNSQGRYQGSSELPSVFVRSLEK